MPDPGYVKEAFARIADRYVITNHILSGGLDIWWRHLVTKRIKTYDPESLVDIASGTGDLALKIQKELPACKVLATDFCPEMLQHAARRGVRQTMVADAMNLPFGDEKFQILTVAFGLRNVADYSIALKEMRRVIRHEGKIFILDFSMPTGIWKLPYRFYLHHILPKLAGLLTNEKDAYEYLGGSIEEFPSGQAMKQLLVKNGFSNIVAIPMSFGVVTLYEGTKHVRTVS